MSRTSPRLRDLARTARLYVQLLLAFLGVDLPAEVSGQAAGAVRALAPGDASLAAYRLRGLTISYPDWVRAARVRAGLRAQWQGLFSISMSFCARQCRPWRFRTTIRRD